MSSKAVNRSSFLLITSSGKLGSHLISGLLSSKNEGYPIPRLRIFVHSKNTQEKLKKQFHDLPNNTEFLVGDYLNVDNVNASVRGGITHIFHVGPPFHPQEAAICTLFIDAAKSREEGEPPFFLYCSVLHPFRRKMVNHRVKLDAEEYLIESRLPYAVLQPTHFMQNTDVKSIVEKGVITQPYNVDNLQGFVDLQDVAEVSVKVLNDTKAHDRARYELLGQNATYTDVAKIIAEVSGKAVKSETLNLHEAAPMIEARAQSFGLGNHEHRINGFMTMLAYYNRWGLTGNSNVLRLLLGREPSTWEDYVKRAL